MQKHVIDTIRWMEDVKAENVLNSLGIEYRYKVVSCDEIDVGKSRVNKARPTALNPEAVEDYAASMEHGSCFPAIVLATLPGSKNFIVAGGNHRHEAALSLDAKEIYAIIIDVDDLEFDLVCKVLNTVEGQRTDRATRIQQACDLVTMHGVSVREAAETIGIGREAVNNALRANEVRVKLVASGVHINGKTSQVQLLPLQKYINDKNVLKALGQFVKAGANGEQVRELVRSCGKKPTEASRIDLIEQALADKGPTKKCIKRTKCSRLLEAFGRIERLSESVTQRQQLQITDDIYPEVHQRWGKLKKKVDSILTNG